MSQTSYSLVPPVGVEGLLADMQEGVVVIPRMAAGLVPVGKLCAPGTNQLLGPPLASVSPTSTTSGQIKALPVGLTTDPMLTASFVGIPIYDASRAPYDATSGYACYSDKDYCDVLYKGTIYVLPEAGSAPTDQGDVYVRVAAGGGGSVLGAFSSAAGAGKVLLSQAKWISGFMQSNLAILRLR